MTEHLTGNINKITVLINNHLILYFFATLLCISIYWPGLYGPLIQDDLNNLGYLLNSKLNTNELLSHINSFSGEFGRPVSMLSFTVNALLSQDIFYWKLTNLGIHLICGVFIYFLIENILYFANFDKPYRTTGYLPSIVAAIWLLHPLHISTVLYTVQRMAQLSALFLFGAMLSYLIARKRQFRGLPYIPYQLLTWLVLFPLAVFSKENGALLPLFVALSELFLIQKDRISNKLMGQILIATLVLSLSILWYKSDWLMAGYHLRGFTLWERLMTESRVLAAYLGMLLIPVQANMSFVHDNFAVSKSLFEPATTILSLIFITFLIGSAFFFRKKQPAYSFGVLFFFIGHLLESTILPLELMYEHRNYQPSVGIFLAIAVPFSQLLPSKMLSGGIAVLFLSLLTFTTWLRADSWSSEYRFYVDLGRFNPNSEQVAYLLSQRSAKYGDYHTARTIMEPFNSLGKSFHLLSIACIDQKTLTDEQMSGLVNPTDTVTNYAINSLVKVANLGLEHKCNFNFSTFIGLMDELLRQPNTSASNKQLIMMYKSHYLWHSNKKNDAIGFLKNTYAVNTENLTPLFLACEWSIDEKMPVADEICPDIINKSKAIPYKFRDLALKVHDRYNIYLTELKDRKLN